MNINLNESPEDKAKRLGVPLIPALPVEDEKEPYNPNPTVGVCGGCGIELKGMMHYSCNRPNCPVFKKFMMGAGGDLKQDTRDVENLSFKTHL